MKYTLEIRSVPKDGQPIAYLGKKVAKGSRTEPGKYSKIGYLCLVKKKDSQETAYDSDDEEISTYKSRLAKLKGGKKVKYEVGKPDIKNVAEELKLDGNYCFLPLHRDFVGSNRETIFINGCSGQGKSEWISKYLKSYKTLNPKNKIVLFSTVDQDDCLDRYHPVRVDLGTLLDDPLDLDELNDTCCIFDDTNSIPDEQLKKAVRSVRDLILEKGRHHDITCLCTSHIARDFANTRYPLRECDQLIFFSRNNEYQAESTLSQYTHVGKNKKLLDYIFDKNPRWVMLCRNGQSYILMKRGCMLIGR